MICQRENYRAEEEHTDLLEEIFMKKTWFILNLRSFLPYRGRLHAKLCWGESLLNVMFSFSCLFFHLAGPCVSALFFSAFFCSTWANVLFYCAIFVMIAVKIAEMYWNPNVKYHLEIVWSWSKFSWMQCSGILTFLKALSSDPESHPIHPILEMVDWDSS